MRKTNSFPFSFACICCGGARAGARAGAGAGAGGAFTLNAYDVMCYIIYIYIHTIYTEQLFFFFFFRQILVVSHDIYTLL